MLDEEVRRAELKRSAVFYHIASEFAASKGLDDEHLRDISLGFSMMYEKDGKSLHLYNLETATDKFVFDKGMLPRKQGTNAIILLSHGVLDRSNIGFYWTGKEIIN